MNDIHRKRDFLCSFNYYILKRTGQLTMKSLNIYSWVTWFYEPKGLKEFFKYKLNW